MNYEHTPIREGGYTNGVQPDFSTFVEIYASELNKLAQFGQRSMLVTCRSNHTSVPAPSARSLSTSFSHSAAFLVNS